MPGSKLRSFKGTRFQRASNRNWLRYDLGLRGGGSDSTRKKIRRELARLRKEPYTESARREKKRLKLPIYTDLTGEAKCHRTVFELFMKHAVKKGKVKGTLLEVGPGLHGGMLPFFLSNEFFQAMSGEFKVFGIQRRESREKLGPQVASRIVTTGVQDIVNAGDVKIADFVIGNNVITSPNADAGRKGSTFHSMAQLLKKGGKMLIEVEQERRLPSQEAIEKAGLKLIDSHIDRKVQDFVFVLERVK